ncbi:hypothetical protein D3C83_174740 [compost metagenome]
MLAAAVRVDRLLERHIRRIVARNDGSRPLFGDCCLEFLIGLFFVRPAVIEGRARLGLEASLDL